MDKANKKVQKKIAKHEEKDDLDKYFDDSDSCSSSDSLEDQMNEGAKGSLGASANPSKLIDFELIKLLQYCKLLEKNK